MISVVVVDDHPIFRLGVVQALSLEADISVVGEAMDGAQALELLRTLYPEVVVMDINLPEYNGQWVTYRVCQENLPTRVLLLTGYDDVEQAIHAAVGGAAGYSSKEIEPPQLGAYVRHISKGGYVFDGRLMDEEMMRVWLVQEVRRARLRYSPEEGQAFLPLTEREMEVLHCLVHGASNKQIAWQLGISQQTVKNHITAILRKLNVEDRTQAVIAALYLGWIKLSSLKF